MAAKKAAKNKVAKKKVAKGEGDENIVDLNEVEIVEWHEACEIDPSDKAEMLWLHAQMLRCGVRSISDVENLIAKAE